ncbi:uncharacterized protein VTP21DRAFT_2317 [Calcarisporiella thermophila]|uniref:uncharacterized protein n=1 Tax=Calcarisporiella thermophila TaxID=911321 RepID=UPI0037437806
MSWSGFKKNLNRAGTSLMQRAGAMEKTVDQEFDEEERRFRVLEQKSEKLYKETKGYLDSLRAVAGTQKRIAETIQQFYDESAPMGVCGIRYKQTMDNLEDMLRLEMDQTYRQTVIDPIGRFCSYFPEINDAIKKRNKKLLDYDASRNRVRKLVDKTSEDASRLPRAEQEANVSREIYEHLNMMLTNELPKVVDIRVPYLDPSFEAMVKAQLKYFRHTHEKLDTLHEYFPPEDPTLEHRVEGILQQMRDLTICGIN